MFRIIMCIVVVCCGCFMEIYGQKFVCSDGPPKGTNPSTCCKKAKSFNETIMKNCFNSYKNIPMRVGKGLQGPLNGLECAFECVFNATRVLDNDRPNPQALVQKVTAMLASEPDWIPAVTAGINYCVAQVNANATRLKSSLKGDQVNGKTVCSPTSAFLVGCMFTYEFRNCPASMWSANDAKCTELKAYFNQCPTPLIN